MERNERFTLFLSYVGLSWEEYDKLDSKSRLNARFMAWISELKALYTDDDHIWDHNDFTRFIKEQILGG